MLRKESKNEKVKSLPKQEQEKYKPKSLKERAKAVKK